MTPPLHEESQDSQLENRTSISQNDFDQLYQALHLAFNDKEVRNLSSTFGISFKELPGPSERERRRAFIRRIYNSRQMLDLLTECRELRPRTSWT